MNSISILNLIFFIFNLRKNLAYEYGEYIGCFIDGQKRDLNNKNVSTNGKTIMTTEYCVKFCQGYKYAATQAGYN